MKIEKKIKIEADYNCAKIYITMNIKVFAFSHASALYRSLHVCDISFGPIFSDTANIGKNFYISLLYS